MIRLDDIIEVLYLSVKSVNIQYVFFTKVSNHFTINGIFVGIDDVGVIVFVSAQRLVQKPFGGFGIACMRDRNPVSAPVYRQPGNSISTGLLLSHTFRQLSRNSCDNPDTIGVISPFVVRSAELSDRVSWD